jgi:hypothetical protein
VIPKAQTSQTEASGRSTGVGITGTSLRSRMGVGAWVWVLRGDWRPWPPTSTQPRVLTTIRSRYHLKRSSFERSSGVHAGRDREERDPDDDASL